MFTESAEKFVAKDRLSIYIRKFTIGHVRQATSKHKTANISIERNVYSSCNLKVLVEHVTQYIWDVSGNSQFYWYSRKKIDFCWAVSDSFLDGVSWKG